MYICDKKACPHCHINTLGGIYMKFFDKLGKTASEAYKVTADKTGKLAKEAKLRMKMGELKSEINEIYKDIGKAIYENHVREEKQDIKNELEEKCTKIDCLSDEIESILKECLELKDKKQCPNCYVEIEKDVKFCPECGTKQEAINQETKEVEIIDNKNNEINEKNKEDNKDTDKCEEKTNLEKTVEVESDVDENHDETVEYLEVENESDNVE